jgi:small-conductance mechanosensitive channel
VKQKGLSDFSVEYEILFNMDRPEDRIVILSELHANILDAFNEFGVQMMVPHYEMQPEGKVVVSKSEWNPAPANDSSPAA